MMKVQIEKMKLMTHYISLYRSNWQALVNPQIQHELANHVQNTYIDRHHLWKPAIHHSCRTFFLQCAKGARHHHCRWPNYCNKAWVRFSRKSEMKRVDTVPPEEKKPSWKRNTIGKRKKFRVSWLSFKGRCTRYNFNKLCGDGCLACPEYRKCRVSIF